MSSNRGVTRISSTRLCPESRRNFRAVILTSHDSSQKHRLEFNVGCWIANVVKDIRHDWVYHLELVQQPMQVAAADTEFARSFQLVAAVHAQSRSHEFLLEGLHGFLERAAGDLLRNRESLQF